MQLLPWTPVEAGVYRVNRVVDNKFAVECTPDICAKGSRSLTAAKLAERLGYETIYNVDGGTAACARAGFLLVAARTAA